MVQHKGHVVQSSVIYVTVIVPVTVLVTAPVTVPVIVSSSVPGTLRTSAAQPFANL